METCSYEEIDKSYKKTSDRKPFFKQLFVCSGIWTLYFVYGISLGTPTVLIPQLRKETNSTGGVSMRMATWLSAVFGYAGLPWAIILPILMNRYGRKKTLHFCIINTLASFCLLYFTSNLYLILFSEIMQGVTAACTFTTCMILVAEYTSPRYRGVFLTIKSASIFWGVWIANAIGTFFHWRNIPLCGLICMCYPLISILFWPESPYWLANVGRFDDCTKAHRWLKGSGKNSEKELKMLLNRETGHEKETDIENNSRNVLRKITKAITLKEFYKANLLSSLLLLLLYSNGKIACSMYAVDIIKKIAGEDAAYKGMLTLDGVTVFSMYISCGLAKKFKRRTLLFSATSAAIFFLFTMSLYLYLVKLKIFEENKYVSLTLLAAYSVSVCCGPMVLSTSIISELMPLKFRNLSSCLIALVSKFSMGTVVSLSPYIFENGGMHGTFLVYGLMSSVCLILLYIYLPETKDKTLHEIKSLICGRHLVVNEDEQPKELMRFNVQVVKTS